MYTKSLKLRPFSNVHNIIFTIKSCVNILILGSGNIFTLSCHVMHVNMNSSNTALDMQIRIGKFILISI